MPNYKIQYNCKHEEVAATRSFIYCLRSLLNTPECLISKQETPDLGVLALLQGRSEHELCNADPEHIR